MSLQHTRIDYSVFTQKAPSIYAGLVAIGTAVKDSGLDQKLAELVKVRVSQINGCAFCIQYHLNIARQIGVEAVKLDLLAYSVDRGQRFWRSWAPLEREHFGRCDFKHGRSRWVNFGGGVGVPVTA